VPVGIGPLVAMQDLLFVSHRVPYPPDKGEKIRAWNIFRHLARTHRMHLGCLIDDPADWQRLSELEPLCASLGCFPLTPKLQRIKALLRLRPGMPLSAAYFDDPRLRRWVATTLRERQIRRIFVFSSAMAPYVMPLREAGPPGDTVRVLDMVDVDSAKWTSYAAGARWPMRAVWAREGRTLLALERRAALSFDRSLFVSEHEWRHFVSLAPECAGRTGWIDNGVDLVQFSPTQTFPDPFNSRAPHIVFTGRMDYWPNVDAVCSFARDMLPGIRRRQPEAVFCIVGASPDAEVLRLAELPGVEVTGRVADTRPYLAHATVVVAPLRIARGIQNKVLEAMAMGRPVIASPEAFEGVRAVPEQDILLASGAEATIQRVIDIIDGRYPGLGAAARRAMESSHDWAATLAPLDELFDAGRPDPAEATR
jgi:sugar transferase (PEP-CTERM/EpsH1 system associated)